MNKEQELIYNVAFDLIEIRLDKKESIIPFTVVIESETKKPVIGMYEQFTTNTTEQLEIIRDDLRKKIVEKKITALCLSYDVLATDPRTNKKTDAIVIELASKGEEPLEIYIPYDLNSTENIKIPFQVKAMRTYFT